MHKTIQSKSNNQTYKNFSTKFVFFSFALHLQCTSIVLCVSPWPVGETSYQQYYESHLLSINASFVGPLCWYLWNAPPELSFCMFFLFNFFVKKRETGTHKRNSALQQRKKKQQQRQPKCCKSNEKLKKKSSTRTNIETIAFGDQYVARFFVRFVDGIKQSW